MECLLDHVVCSVTDLGSTQEFHSGFYSNLTWVGKVGEEPSFDCTRSPLRELVAQFSQSLDWAYENQDENASMYHAISSATPDSSVSKSVLDPCSAL